MDEGGAPLDESAAGGGGGGRGKGRPRFFDKQAARLCWEKADVVAGRHPERWRKDSAGNIVCRKLRGCEGCLCYEYDHIQPFTKGLKIRYRSCCNGSSDRWLAGTASIVGGETDVKNCQILQSRVNRFKGDKENLGKEELEQYSCNLKFTGFFSMVVYGRASRGKELDLIEMAVYGDVLRPGLQCKCKSVGETLGIAISKAKGPAMASCELPYQKVEERVL